MKAKYLLLSLLFISTSIVAQNESPYGKSTDKELPEWVRLLYTENPDVGAVIDAYESYYKSHPFQKNKHTQYYKRWLRDRSTYEYQFRDAQLSDAEIQRLRIAERSYLRQSLEGSSQRNATANWTCIGPTDWDHDAADRSYAPGSAHVYTVEHCDATPTTLYAGTATCGLWKSTNEGGSWTNVTKDLLVNQVYAIEVSHADANVVYASMFNNIYKTMDGGSTWNPTGDVTFQGLSFSAKDIRMHPSNTNIVLAATDGGLFRTSDAAANWTTVLSGSFQEIEFHPSNSDIVYVIKQVGDQTEFYKSTDAGLTFTLQTTGWPTPSNPDENLRAEIAVTADNPSKVYALLTGKVNGGSGLYGVYISTDEGVSWSFSCCGPQPGGLPDLTTMPPNINTMAWQDDGSDDGGQYYYDVGFAVSPTNEDSVFLGGVNLWVSDDGGATFTCPAKWSHPHKANYVHADIHDIHFYDNGQIWLACDGGIFTSSNAGASFERRVLGISGTDFWGFGVGFWDAEVMLGGAYHNGTLLKHGNVYLNDWICTDGGDGTGGFVNVGKEDQVYSNYNVKTLSDDRTLSMATRSYAVAPYTHYIVGRSSQITFDPRSYNVQYYGREDGLWKTEDDHFTATLVNDFGGSTIVADVELGWTNVDTIYVTTWPGYWDEKKVYRSYDGGANFTEITPSTSVFNSRRYIEYDVVVSEKDAKTIWLARVGRQTGDNNKLFKSTDGGATWTNITTATLSDETLTNITLHRGTNNGIYIGTSRAVYYKNESMPDWDLFNTGLPLSTFSRRLYINYRTGTIANGTNRSAWRSDLYETAAPKAQISVDKLTVGCARDTVYFYDYSALSETSATWSWSFPGASWVSSTTERTPKVLYDAPGNYDVSLSVSDVNGSDSQSLSQLINVQSLCNADTIPGKVLSCAGAGDYVQLPTLNKSMNSLTISAWIKPTGTQDAYTGIVINDGETAGMNFRNNNELGYHWPGGSTHWAWSSGLTIPADEWSYVVMVVSPTNITFYLNEEKVSRNVSLAAVDFTTVKIGSYKGWSSRNFKGEIDEVLIWDRALSEAEVRSLRHLTKEHLVDSDDASYDPNLIAYYQFNDDASTIYDRVNTFHGTLQGSASLASSAAPVGAGESVLMDVSSGGAASFADAKVVLGFPASGTYPAGDVVVSRLNVSADHTVLDQIDANHYWVINNYGNASFSVLDSIRFEEVSGVEVGDAAHPNFFHLHKRTSNEEGATWSASLDAADRVAENGDGTGTIVFSTDNGLTSFSQFVISRVAALPIELLRFTAHYKEEGNVLLNWETAVEEQAAYFEIQRSKDGRTWQSIVEQPVKGSNSYYQWLDEGAFEKEASVQLYYRLKMWDLDGTYRFSEIRTVTKPLQLQELTIYPNPAEEFIRVDINLPIPTEIHLRLFDVQGRRIYHKILSTNKGANAFQIYVAHLPAGTYNLQIQIGEEQMNKKVLLR